MGDVRGFMKYGRRHHSNAPPEERVKHYNEFLVVLNEDELRQQGARCMDCGIPFCHTGCPLGNIIPDWNDLVYRGQWREALDRLHSTNNFPEFTGRVCPAPCENACVLGINEDPVAIKEIEMTIADRGFAEGWIDAEPPAERTGKKVAIVGSGPAGLAAAQQLNRAGHSVTVFERADRPGGLLMYGIPDFKLEKAKVWRRVKQMEAEGVVFRCNSDVGGNVPTQQLRDEFDAILLCGGSTAPRDLPIPGRNLKGVHFAMEFLPQQNKRNQGDQIPVEAGGILATGKDVIIIGGGDTGSDCTGTSNRHGAKTVTQFELLPEPPDLGYFPRAKDRPKHSPWPYWTLMLRTSTSHEEGCDRHFSVLTKEFIGDDAGNVAGLKTCTIEWYNENGQQKFREVPGSEKTFDCQLVLLAMGFLGPEKKGAINDLGLELDGRGNVKCNAEYQTSVDGVFAAGDLRRGQSLVVWAIHEGREAARSVDKFLMGVTNLPSTHAGDFAAR